MANLMTLITSLDILQCSGVINSSPTNLLTTPPSVNIPNSNATNPNVVALLQLT